MAAALCAATCFTLAGCKSPATATGGGSSGGKAAKGKTGGAADGRDPVDSLRQEADAAPTPTPTPAPPPATLTIAATDMATDCGRPDTSGGLRLASNGFAQKVNFELPFRAYEVVIEMRGDPARGIWPEVDLNVYDAKTEKNHVVFARDFCTSPDYAKFKVPVPQDKIIEPGTYVVTFRFHNNEDFPDTGEDRSAYLKGITFVPLEQMEQPAAN